MKYAAATILIIGVIICVQGAIAFWLRFNFLTGEHYGPSLMPIYLIGYGIGIVVLGLATKAIAGRKRG